MKRFIRGSVSALLLGAVTITGAPAAVSAKESPAWNAPYDAVLYELNENMSLRSLRDGKRKATSQLLGFAKKGSPLCPPALAVGVDFCTINATGSDSISLLSGLGRFGGTFTVVGQDTNPVDSPEAVLGKGRFSGDMDFSPAILRNVPLGSVVGHMVLNGGRKQPFTGTFRLPFVVPQYSPACVAVSGYAGCPMIGYSKPMYLVPAMENPANMEPVDYRELAIGFPTVRFEINFD